MNLNELTNKYEIEEVINRFSNLEIDVQAQAKLFTPDAHVTIHANGEVMMELKSRDEMVKAFSAGMANAKNSYHMNGQQVVELISDTKARDTHYCEATILNEQDGQKTVSDSKIRYVDTLVKQDGQWLIKDRQQYIVFVDNRSLD